MVLAFGRASGPGPPTTSLAHDNKMESLSSKVTYVSIVAAAGMLKSAEKFDVKKAFVFSSWSCRNEAHAFKFKTETNEIYTSS
jgi:hypothetical protein